MGELTRLELEAIEQLAEHALAAPAGNSSSELRFELEGRRIFVDFKPLIRGPAQKASEVHLRLDKVVVRVIGRLRTELSDIVPDDKAAVFTMTAPIRLAAKTAAALENQIRGMLSRSTNPPPWTGEILGNRIRLRFIPVHARRAFKVAGLVHNPDADPELLITMAQELLLSVGEMAGGSTLADDKWLVLAGEGGWPAIGSWRKVYAQLGVETEYSKILIIPDGIRIGVLAG